MKKLYRLVVLLLLPLTLFGQSNKFSVGIGLGFGYSNILNHTYLEDRYDFTPSPSLNFDFIYHINSRGALALGTKIDRRGGKFTSMDREIIRTGNTVILGDMVRRVNKNEFAYFTLPIVYTHKIAALKKLDIFIGAGAYYARRINQVWNYEMLDIFALSEANTLDFDYKKWDAGFILNAGITIPVKEIADISASLNYMQGLTNFIADSEENEAKHQRIFGEVSFYFKVGRSKRN